MCKIWIVMTWVLKRTFCAIWQRLQLKRANIAPNKMTFHRDNHYLPCLYLKRFEACPGQVLTYRILVSHPNVPLWRPSAIKGVAYRAHLYTRIAAGVQSDEFETWLNEEFETPAEEAIRRATQDQRLTKTDWYNLVRFVAAQDLRTPARLLENLRAWRETVPTVLQETLEKSVHALEMAKSCGTTIAPHKVENSQYIPFRVLSQVEPGERFGTVRSEVVVGRGLWLYSIKHLLATTVNVLLNQRWSILRSPDNLSWFTSDSPVIRLNYYAGQNYDFQGGWGNPGTEILFPLDQRHLLYTKIGFKPQPRGTVIKHKEAEMIRRFIAQHAYRFIFAASPDPEISKLRPRTVDRDLLKDEDEQWRRWHEDQSRAEREMMGRTGLLT